jgi:hypothetical protein
MTIIVPQKHIDFTACCHCILLMITLFTGANDFATIFYPSIPFSFLTCPDIVKISLRWIQSFWSVMIGRCQWARGNFNFCLKGRIMQWGIPVCWCYTKCLLHWGLLCGILGFWFIIPLQSHHLKLAHSRLWFLFLLSYICIAPSYVAAKEGSHRLFHNIGISISKFV